MFLDYPTAHIVLKYAGAAYLLYLAWRIANAGQPKAGDEASQPLSFVEAAGFQWVNPKAWTLALSAIPAFTTIGTGYFTDVIVVAAVFAVVCFPSCAVWCVFGTAIRQFVRSKRVLRIVNLVLAGSVAASIVLLFV